MLKKRFKNKVLHYKGYLRIKRNQIVWGQHGKEHNRFRIVNQWFGLYPVVTLKKSNYLMSWMFFRLYHIVF